MPLDGAIHSRLRTANRLTALKVAKLKVPGLYEDGAGLRLVVTAIGTKRWVLRLTINGLRVERGLGVWPDVSLDDARRKAVPMRQAAKDGIDIRKEQRRISKAKGVSFTQAFDDFFAIRKQHLSNGKHVQQWQNTMRDYVFPTIGKRPVAEITASEVIDVLKPIWFRKPETAGRVLQRVKATFDSAILRGTREKANPCIGVAQELGSLRRAVHHHPALPWREVPAFVQTLRKSAASEATRLLFEFLILTIVRSGEARGALWQEIDLAQKTWSIPGFSAETGRRMKNRETHIVPLSERAIEILGRSRTLYDGPLIFPGTSDRPLSDNTLSKLMRDGKAVGTPHGFRSAFKDWAAERGVRDEVSEAALAHSDRDKVRAAYRRTRFLDERRCVMQDWALFVSR
ncbi:tyrosine-type recombinase/integrase [Hyphomicrobium sp.]|jgi:integrase|uniref:tyrosine-type recombinase/integrase n=1 Tax=Hyphomicrobium sp. TaxID=82 RepID=UPI00356400E8